MARRTLIPLLLVAFAPATVIANDTAAQLSRTYRVRQTVTLREIPKRSKVVDLWVAIPDDDRYQQVLDMSIDAVSSDWRITREAENGNRFLYLQIKNPSAESINTVVEFTAKRRAAYLEIDPQKVGQLTAMHRQMFAEELRPDSPHMQVTDELRRLADEACNGESNLAHQATRLIEYVANYADHYSKDPKKPNCGVGDAQNCMTNKGGCCTDLHSLFIALARAKGIPSRLQMGYRVLEKNLGKEVDPGYRCWPEYFVPGYGWVAADIVESDAAEGFEKAQWQTGLSERRVWLNQGREFNLVPQQAGPRVNTMVIGYAEVDGKPVRLLPDGDKAPQLVRTVLFVESAADESAALFSKK